MKIKSNVKIINFKQELSLLNQDACVHVRRKQIVTTSRESSYLVAQCKIGSKYHKRKRKS